MTDSKYTPVSAVGGVGPAIAKKLDNANITTAELLAVQTPEELQKQTKIAEGSALKIITNARKLIGKYGFKSGLEIEQEMVTKRRLSTGIPKMDEAMFGGIEVGSLVEFYGPARGGKTQWVTQLAVMSQLSYDQGGLEGRVLWLDTESSFKPWNIRANSVRRGLDPDIALDNIGYSQIWASDQITDLFENIPKLCVQDNIKLVVIDSFTGLFRVEYSGLEKMRVRQQDMNSLLNQMRRIAMATETIFAYTNQAISKISTFGSSNPNAPVGGHILSHASDYRFYTRRTKDDIRKVDLQDNAGLPEFGAELAVGWGGLWPDSKTKKAKEPDIQEYFEKRGILVPKEVIDHKDEEEIESENDVIPETESVPEGA